MSLKKLAFCQRRYRSLVRNYLLLTGGNDHFRDLHAEYLPLQYKVLFCIGHQLPEATIAAVIAFQNDDEVSVNMPGMKDCVSVYNDEGQRVKVQKRLILSNLKELHAFFRLRYVDMKIGFSSFASSRSKHCVLAGASGTHTVCVCSMHQNVKLMMLGARLKSLTKDMESPLNQYSDCLNAILCPTPSSQCYLGHCPDCPRLEMLHHHLIELMESNNIDNVTYKHWVSKPRTSLETATTSSEEFVSDFCDKIKALLPHSFIAKEQAMFLRNLKESLPENELIVICDFAENYSFVVQNAAPGYHWNNNQATVYPVVIYFKSKNVLCHRSLVIISDALSHDSIAVHVYAHMIIDFLKTISTTVSKVYYFSDGAPQQFKNYKNFVNLYYHKEDFGIEAEWHYFATAHGKGPCDGVGGTVKRMAARASLQLPPDQQITTPIDLYEWGSNPTNLPNITVKFSPQEEHDSMKTTLESRFNNAKRIPSTQKVHCVIPQKNGLLRVQLFSNSENYESHKIIKQIN